MNTPLLYSCVPIAPSKTMTCSGSSSRAISGFSSNCSLRLARGAGSRASHRVILGFGVMNDHCRRRLLGEKLERFSQIHPERFLRRQKPEHRGVVVEVGTGAVAPRIPLSTRNSQLFLYAAM